MKLPRDFWLYVGDALGVVCLAAAGYGLALILYGLGWQ